MTPRVLPVLEEPSFLDAFRRKGRFSRFLERIPLHVVLSSRAALRGAVELALTSGTDTPQPRGREASSRLKEEPVSMWRLLQDGRWWYQMYGPMQGNWGWATMIFMTLLRLPLGE